MTAADRAARIARVTRWVWQNNATRPDRIQRITEAPEMDAARGLVELYAGQTEADRDNDLHAQAHYEDDATATLALYGQYMGLIERLAATYGTAAARQGKNEVFGPDDAHQEAALTLLEIIADGPNHKDFAGRFSFEARDAVYEECWKHLRELSVSRDRAREVQNAINLYDGDLNAASNYLATVPPVRNRISRERFFSILAAIDPSNFIQLDAPVGEGQTPISETVADPTAADAFARVLGLGFTDEVLAAEWDSLSDREREILSLLVGLDDTPMTQAAVAETLGTTQKTVSTTARRALDKLRQAKPHLSAPAPIGPNERQITEPRRSHATKEPAPEFEVHVRRVGEPAPDLSREGIHRGGLSIR